jgi:AcrR family transcriptional regulator
VTAITPSAVPATAAAQRTPQLRAPEQRTQEQRTAASDAAMADAASALICERGAAATTLKDVGVRAGYSRGLAGYRFGSKAGLWSFLVRTIGDEWLAQLAGAVAGTTGLATIHAAADAHCALLLGPSERIRAFYILWFESVGPDPALRGVIAHVHERRRHDVQRWIEGGQAEGAIDAGVDARAIAEQFVATIVGIVYAWLVADPGRPDAAGSGPARPDTARVAAQHEQLKRQMTRALALPQLDEARAGPGREIG